VDLEEENELAAKQKAIALYNSEKTALHEVEPDCSIIVLAFNMETRDEQTKIKLKTVDDAINELLSEDEYFTTRDGFALYRIQDIAKKMHPHYWKHRKEILEEIHKWAEHHPFHSVWQDAKGTKYLVGYGEQMHPFYGKFREGRDEDILELVKQEG